MANLSRNDKNTGRTVAIKVVEMDETEEELSDVLEEVRILQQMQCPQVTKCLASFVKDTKLYMILEYCGGGSCADLLKVCGGSLFEGYIALIMREALRGLEYIHAQRKIHRDIKAANILLNTRGEVKLADFGVSSQLTWSVRRKTTFVGTPYWMAPEIIKSSDGYNHKADIWSLGITAYELAIGEPPHSDLEPARALMLIAKSPPPVLPRPTKRNCNVMHSETFCCFVRLCLIYHYQTRPSATELLNSHFVRSCNLPVSCLVPLIGLRKTHDHTVQDENCSTSDREKSNRGSNRPDWTFDIESSAEVEDDESPISQTGYNSALSGVSSASTPTAISPLSNSSDLIGSPMSGVTGPCGDLLLNRNGKPKRDKSAPLMQASPWSPGYVHKKECSRMPGSPPERRNWVVGRTHRLELETKASGCQRQMGSPPASKAAVSKVALAMQFYEKLRAQMTRSELSQEMWRARHPPVVKVKAAGKQSELLPASPEAAGCKCNKQSPLRVTLQDHELVKPKLDSGGCELRILDTTSSNPNVIFERVMLKALDKLEARTITSQSRRATNDLRLRFVFGERQVPGLSGTLIEEILFALRQL